MPKMLMKLTPGHYLVLSISPKFYAQLLQAQIPKAQKNSHAVILFCAFGICAGKNLE